jgi:hypothetical protein
MAKRRSGYLSVEVDASEVLDEIDDALLIQEVEDRKLGAISNYDPVDDLREARAELLRNRPAEALAILERLLNPKWNSAKAAEIALRSRQ